MPAQDTDKYAVPAAWGQSPFQDLELPSGHTILAKRIDLAAIVAAEMIDEFDKLAPAVEENVVKPAQGRKPQDRPKKRPTKKEREAAEAASLKEFFKQENIETLMLLMGRIIPQIVIKPKVQSCYIKDESGKWALLDADDREDDAVYADSIPMGDQMAILSFGMEGMDMEGLQQFREQSDETLDDVEGEPVYQDPPVPTP